VTVLKPNQEKHRSDYPTARNIRRACHTELYRTAKRLKIRILPEQLNQAKERYAAKVFHNLPWIYEHQSNRKKLADWWEEAVSPEIAELWEVDRGKLCEAFRNAFGG
jgi:toxin CptA